MDVRKIKDITIEEVAKEFIEFVEIKGFCIPLRNNLGVVYESDIIGKVADCIREDMESLNETYLTTMRVFDIGYSIFDWSETPEGANFWCLLERDWQDHVRYVLFPIYEKLGLLVDVEND